jgi:predicted ATP-grasp superfamily ATP-dependent carboligase
MIFGASTRAAAQSAVRAGFRPHCADRFADEDLREIADIVPLADYPDGLIEMVAASPALPWIYTGGLENRPDLLEELAKLRPLWGNSADVVRAARNPLRLFEALRTAGLPVLEVRGGDLPPPADGRWMLKPWRGSAGRGIHVWQEEAPPPSQLGEPCYFQRRAEGAPISALFLSARDVTTLIGMSRQLIGLRVLSAGPFAYSGSVGPIEFSETICRQITETGVVLASEFKLRGLFGIDFVLKQSAAWPTEINPRYTASVEIYEFALGMPLLEWHCRACQVYESRRVSRLLVEEFQAALGAARWQKAAGLSAKAVVYAPFSLRVPDLIELERSVDFRTDGVEIADRPRAGSEIVAKAPVCTLLAKRAESVELATFERSLATLAVAFERGRLAE